MSNDSRTLKNVQREIRNQMKKIDRMSFKISAMKGEQDRFHQNVVNYETVVFDKVYMRRTINRGRLKELMDVEEWVLEELQLEESRFYSDEDTIYLDSSEEE